MSRLAVKLEAEQEKFETAHPLLPDAASQEELVRTVQEYLRANFTEEVSLGELAERFHVNPPYLSRLFKRQVGAAPARYLRDLRISLARKLLDERRDLEVKEIGVLAGYSDQGYFSRIFKQSVGVSPQEYRERHAHKEA
jgi:two-component system response regulator YesN